MTHEFEHCTAYVCLLLRDLIRMDAVVSLMAIGGHHHTDADEEFVVTSWALKQQAAKQHCGGKAFGHASHTYNCSNAIALTLWLCSDSCHSRCVPGQK